MSHPTFVHLLRWRVLHQPERLSYVFLSNRGAEETVLSYSELDRKARVIAANLQALRATGQRALLLFPPGLEYVAAFFGCLYAGVVAVPAYPFRVNRPMLRLQAIVEDAGCDLVLTTSQMVARLQSRIQQDEQLRNLQCVATDRFADGSE